MSPPNFQPPAYYPPPAGHIDAFPPSLQRTTSRASTILPQYTTGGQVIPTGTNTTPNILSIQLNNPQLHYDIGDVIHGTITFSPRLPTEITAIGVTFLGEEVTTRSGWTSDTVVKRLFGLSQHLVPIDALPPNGICSPGFTYSYPFSLLVPDLIPLSEASCCKEGIPVHYRLPPSLGSPPQYPESIYNVPNNAARITYSLQAFAKGPATKNRGPYTTQYLKYIRIRPSYTPPPSLLSPQILKSQFQKNIKKGLLKRTSSGNVCATVTEAPVLALNDQASSTSVPVKITYTTPSSQPIPPPKIYKISVNLNAVTSYSTRYPLHSNKELDNSSLISEDASSLHVSTQKVESFLLDPSQFRSSWELDPKNSHSYITTMVLPIAFSARHKHYIAPTFESCFISRKYVMEASIHVTGGQQVCVEAPLIVLSSLVSRSNMPFDLEPHQYQSPDIIAASRKHHPVSPTLLDTILGFSSNITTLNSANSSSNSSQISLVSEQQRLEKSPVVRAIM